MGHTERFGRTKKFNSDDEGENEKSKKTLNTSFWATLNKNIKDKDSLNVMNINKELKEMKRKSIGQ